MAHGRHRRHHRVVQKQVLDSPVYIKNKKAVKRKSTLEFILLAVMIAVSITNLAFTIMDFFSSDKE